MSAARPSTGGEPTTRGEAVRTGIVSSDAPVTTPALEAARLVLSRDLRLAFRRPGELLQPLVFFAIVTTLFPLAITPELSQLRIVAPGVVWVAALLSSLLALEFLYREDAHDGTL